MRLVWLVLLDGRSVIADCEWATREALAEAIAKPDTTITVGSGSEVEHIPGGSVRDFVMFDSRASFPAAASIYRYLHL